ncbi:DinB family protein [Cohnella candidum]|uniref:DinB family protein n=1 Tax=Cohnella candidum TaxID=2674991 RepID=A0A3G3JVD6_9BACL|nr:DinB family protein [Cohnella candidum]AYQ72208.1 DinB family protein [Cohnella candidum]
MNAAELAILNLKETRRRSILLWRSLPDEWLTWRPDRHALSFGEMIRHVWGASYGYHMILKNNGSLPSKTQPPYADEPVVSVEQEIALSEPYFRDFITYVETLSEEELRTRVIDRSDVGYRRQLGDMLLRISYHDAVHAGQFLQYMRMAGLDRPQIWD